MKIENIKDEFPIFDEKIQNNDLVYLDSANSSQKPKVVADKINEFYTKQFSNVGRSVHYLAVAATNLYENTRSSMQKYINAKDKNEIVFTKGATEALNLVATKFNASVAPLVKTISFLSLALMYFCIEDLVFSYKFVAATAK